MDKAELQKLKDELLKKRKTITDQLNRVSILNPAVPGDSEPVMPNFDDGHDDDETLNEATQFGIDLALQQELERQLEEIDTTLRKIEQGAYGVCSTCSAPIPPERLQARPTAALCISCAQKK